MIKLKSVCPCNDNTLDNLWFATYIEYYVYVSCIHWQVSSPGIKSLWYNNVCTAWTYFLQGITVFVVCEFIWLVKSYSQLDNSKILSAKTYILHVIWSESFQKLSNVIFLQVKAAMSTIFDHLFYFHFTVFSPKVSSIMYYIVSIICVSFNNQTLSSGRKN